MKYYYEGVEYTVDYIAHSENEIDVFLVHPKTDERVWLSDLPTGIQKEVFALVEADLPKYMEEFDDSQDVANEPEEERVIWRPGDDT